MLALMFAAIAASAPAQANVPRLAATPYFRTLGVAEGLPSSDVREIVQDPDGYLWIGTADGLARYDGVGFKIYRHDANDPGSLSGNDIWALFVDRDNRIWCGGEDAGLNMLGPSRAVFAHYRHDDKDPASLAKGDVYTIAQSADGAIWAGGYASGVNRLDPAGKSFAHYRHVDGDTNSLASDDVLALRGDAAGRMWIGSTVGLDVLAGDGRVQHVDFSAVPGEGHINAAVLFAERDGSMLVGMRRGVVRVGADLRAQPLVGQAATGAVLTDPRIHSIGRDAAGELWIGTHIGLNRLAEDGRLYGYLHDLALPGSLPGAQIGSVFHDREDAMWFATTEGGLGRLPPHWRSFALFRNVPGDVRSLTANAVQGLAENPDGRVWSVNYDGGIDLLDAATGEVERHRAWGVPGKQLNSILVARDGKLWVGHATGLRVYNADWGAFNDLPAGGRDGELLRGQIDLLAQDTSGAVWAKSYGSGLNHIDAVTHAIEHFDPDHSGPRSADIGQIGFDPAGALLVAGVAGLDRFDAQQKKFVPVTGAPTQRVLAFAFAADGSLWLHAIGALEHYRYEHDALAPIERIGAAEGWPALSLGGMQIDARGRLWIASARGLWRFDPATRAIRVFDSRDGLASSEFNRLPLLKRRDGVLFGATLSGIAAWNPQAFNDTTTAIVPVIDAITVRRDGSDVALDPRAATLQLGWNDRDLRVQARLLSYVAPAAHKYQWRLQGAEREWNDAGAQRSFPKLATGHYRLHLRAAASDGVWHEAPTPLVLDMSAPPWASAWAYAIYALTAVALAWFALRTYRQRLEAHHAIALAEQRREFAESASAAKTSFLATMGHEIRTPMTGVLGMTELLLGTSLSEKQRGYAESIASSGQTMLRLVNDSLDLARIEAGKLELVDAPFDLHALIHDLMALAAPLAQNKALAFSHAIAPDAPRQVRGDAVRVRQIFQNLINNAIKFTEQGSIEVVLARACAGGVEFRVRDSGPGIDTATQTRLFRRFEQADGVKRHGGSGLGLAICRDLAALMGGEIALDSVPGQGSTFRVTLPLAEVAATEMENVENSTIVRNDASGAVTGLGGRALRALLVEDDATVAAVIIGLIEAQGHTVRHAAHGLAALGEIATGEFDVALIDFDLPGLDGLALARMLRVREAAEGRPRLYIIGVTARSAGNEEQLALAAGMNAFLRKPLSGGKLRASFVAIETARQVVQIA